MARCVEGSHRCCSGDAVEVVVVDRLFHVLTVDGREAVLRMYGNDVRVLVIPGEWAAEL